MNSSFLYRLAAIDLDDTLLGPDKRVSAENAAAIEELRARGVHVLLASGRRHENMLHFHRELRLSGPVVSCNGALVKDAETGETLLETLMPPALAEEIIEAGDRLGITQNYYHTDGGLYVREETGWTGMYQHRTGSRVDVVGPLMRFGGGHALKLLWIDAPERIAALYTEMSARYAGRLYVTVTDPEYLEFMDPKVSKAAGVAAAAARLGVPREAVVAFGDGNNDVPLLEWAGLGVAMDHGRPAAHAAANLLTPPGDPETGLARGVRAVLDRVEAS